MSALLVARKDIQDAIRSRTLLIVTCLFTTFLSIYTYVTVAMITPSQPVGATDLYLPVASVVAVVGTLLGYNSIVGERASGSVKFLLGQPHTRRDVVVGKFLGRAAVVMVTVLVAFAVVGPHYAVLAASPSVTAYAVLVGKMLVLGVVFVAVSVAFSAALRSTTVATWGAVGIAVLFAFVWDSVILIIETSVFPPQSTPPNWFYLFRRLNPKYAFMDVGAADIGETFPFYLDSWFGGVILVGWLLVSLGIASLRFERGDIA
ncbi:ABC transporter permease [Halocatena marina]|uniref:ABC transporter permease n=1 Tax=Halocatena marina TaxID=2934937 RepID=A0ABD5YXT8_9EURY|nr:ABC transporter permease [Halocatena marina]